MYNYSFMVMKPLLRTAFQNANYCFLPENTLGKHLNVHITKHKDYDLKICVASKENNVVCSDVKNKKKNEYIYRECKLLSISIQLIHCSPEHHFLCASLHH